MIYIIGDSHVSVFSGTDKTHDGLRHIQPEFGTCYRLSSGPLREHINRFEQRINFFFPIKIGSTTAYNSINMLPLIEEVIKEYDIKEEDYLFTCYGEIDIRNHIGSNAEKLGITVSDSIKTCVDKYMETILYLKTKKIKIGVYGSPPSSPNWGSSVMEYKDVVFRNKMTVEFNEYLKDKCIENDVLFKEITKKMILSDGTTDKKYLMDELHLSQEAMPLLIEEFSDII